MSADCSSSQDQAARLEGLVRANAPVVLGTCLAHTWNVHDAEDLAQEALLKALENIHTLRDPRGIRPWLLQIARRLCINHNQRRKPMRRLPENIAAPTQAGNSKLERLQAALAELPEDYRLAISIYYLDGKSCAGVAEALGISEPAVRVRLHRGRVMLHALLKEDNL